jgi:threonine dehydratase
MASHDYLKKTLTARVYDVARETELEHAPNLSARLRNPIYLKREDNQPVFSFKVRGAYNKMAHIPAEALQRGVITASAGNHRGTSDDPAGKGRRGARAWRPDGGGGAGGRIV